jgi:hypothetical protein
LVMNEPAQIVGASRDRRQFLVKSLEAPQVFPKKRREEKQ